ncbi:aldo/keto reductase [Aspergillus foveolatus]|uniref:aldo/keto reductase n=1 Tax=Aspergillus foveolatus TaxID=210207 RepID=UPI003CCDBC51
MTPTTRTKAKTAHVNMMTDTIIASLPLDGLRSIIRSLLTRQPSLTPVFEEQTRNYLDETTSKYSKTANATLDTSRLFVHLQNRIRCMVGCGLCYQALPLLCELVERIRALSTAGADAFRDEIAAVDGDIVQALTAIQKTLLVHTGMRDLTVEETKPLQVLQRALLSCREVWEGPGGQFPLERGLEATTQLLDPSSLSQSATPHPIPSELSPVRITETFTLDADVHLPRIFTGLWQLSSPAWGSAARAKMLEQFSSYVSRGFTAFDMADHYGDAEIIFGRFRSSSAYADSMFAATKYCVFHPMTLSEEAVRANVSERCRRLNTDKINLLQFHWQFYEYDQYITALQYLQQDPRVQFLGLCNFDTEHMQRVIESGVKIVSNQVQFSLIDSRPTIKMAELCSEHNIKLLTYGTLCGGLLAEKWLGQEPPDLYSEKTTPSQRKYYASIRTWGGWPLFQELLRVLKVIADKHSVTISNVATRWVLDFPYVGAVIVGCRMGVSEQSAENLESLGWCLDEEDREMIEGVLQRSQRKAMIESMGDCGGEYR